MRRNTVIGTLAVDGWAVIFGTPRRGLGRAQVLPSHDEGPGRQGLFSASVLTIRCGTKFLWHSCVLLYDFHIK